MKMHKLFLFLFCIGILQHVVAVVPVDLRCGFRVNPIGMDVANPDLSWILQAIPGARAVKQTAYQVLVASTADLLKQDKGDLWNSGEVRCDQMGQIRYAGTALVSSTICFWKVRIWDESGKVSDWSDEAFWISGILNDKDWKAEWISAAGAEKFAHQYKFARSDFNLGRDISEMRANSVSPKDPNYSSMLLRKDFAVEKNLLRAVMHVCGLGHYELTLNGRKVGDQLLAPGWSDYRKTVLYDSYDVTAMVSEGKNAIGLFLSNGMYNIQADSVRYVKFLNSNGPLKAKAQLQLEYSDGSVKQVVTDASWQVSPGPVTYMNEFGGEDYDARLYPSNWDVAGFRPDKRWSKALILPTTAAVMKGLSSAASPIKVIETLKPIKVNKLSPRVWVYDLGQNASIMPEIRVSGAKGSFVRIIPAELLKKDGTVDRASATQDGIRPAWWQYTLASEVTVDWFPKFFYQGCRYLQVELNPAPGETVLPVVHALLGKVVHSSATPIGQFECSNDLFNRIYSLVRWAQRSNMMSVMTDCPAREKLGWLEQYHLNGPSLRYNFDLLNLFGKGMNDMADGQLEDGFIPNIAPEYFHAGSDIKNNGFRNSPEWGSSFILVPWQQYLFSGDLSLIRTYYDRMKRYLGFLDGLAKDHILNVGLGDWYDIGPKPAWGSQLTPVAFTATVIYYYDYQVMAQMASLLGKEDDAKRFTATTEKIRQAFNAKFYNPVSGIYSTGSNTTQSMPLAFGLAEPEHRKRLVDTLVADIRGRGNAFNCGEVGYRFLLKALAMEGHSDLIYDMNNQSEKPGYGYQIKQGATSLTEKWDGSVGSFGSQNHFMSGQINEWFFNDLVGIGVDESGPGFRKFIVHPMVVGDLKWVKGSYQSVSGLITVSWKKLEGQFTLEVSIPANTSATVFVPALSVSGVQEGSVPALQAKGVKFLRMEAGCAVFEVLSGLYTFNSVTELRMKHVESSWKSTDGLILVGQTWKPLGMPLKAVVCLVHGIGEHTGRYAHVAEAFGKEGYALFTADLRGHGKSEGLKGHAPSMEQLMQDMDLLLNQAKLRYPGLPVILYGHSLGGIVALHYGLKRKPDVKAVMVTSPAMHSSLEQQPSKVLAAKVMGSLMPKMTLASGLDVDAISHDLDVVKAYNNDPLVHDKISVGFGKILLQVCKYNLEHSAEFSLPLLLMHGKEDRIAFPSSSTEFAQPLGATCNLVLWEGGYHELHNEPFKADVFKTMTNWMNGL